MASIFVEEVIEVRAYDKEEFMINVVAAKIDPKEAASTLKHFSESIPLQRYNLEHMKRVRRERGDRENLEIILCPEKDFGDMPADVLSRCKPETRVVKIPKCPPITRVEFEEWGKDWPVMFRPNATDKERERGYAEKELQLIESFMTIVSDDTSKLDDITMRKSFGWKEGGIIVNPENCKVGVYNVDIDAMDSL